METCAIGGIKFVNSPIISLLAKLNICKDVRELIPNIM